MINLIRTDSGNTDFIELVKYLDADLAEKDGDEHAFYAQYNKLDNIKYVTLAYENEKAIGCGAIKEFSTGVMEVKRMFTSPESRGKGIATIILSALEKWAVELSYSKCILETGKKQTEAIRLYNRNGYTRIANYEQYAGMDNSLCYEKIININHLLQPE